MCVCLCTEAERNLLCTMKKTINQVIECGWMLAMQKRLMEPQLKEKDRKGQLLFDRGAGESRKLRFCAGEDSVKSAVMEGKWSAEREDLQGSCIGNPRQEDKATSYGRDRLELRQIIEPVQCSRPGDLPVRTLEMFLGEVGAGWQVAQCCWQGQEWERRVFWGV